MGLGVRGWGLGLRVSGFEFQGFGFGVLGFRVWGFLVSRLPGLLLEDFNRVGRAVPA